MNTDDKNIEPVTDLGLDLGYSNQCIQRRLKNDSGAGANAGSSVDKTFVATNALSELVWSPQKGLSLKCADGSFSDIKPSLLRGAGPINMVSGSSTDKPGSKEYFMTSLGESDVRNEVAGRGNSKKLVTGVTSMFPSSESRQANKIALVLAATVDHEEEVDTAVGLSFLQKKEDLRNSRAEDINDPMNLQVDEISGTRENKIPNEPKLDVAQNDPTSEEPFVRFRGVGDGSHTSQTEIASASQVQSVRECEFNDAKMEKAPSSGREHFESPSCMEKERENKVERDPYICPLEKMESTAENDLKPPRGENVCDVATKIVGSKSAQEVQNSCRQDDKILSRDNNHWNKQSPTNSRTRRYQMKGKAKALSDGNLNERVLDMQDDSHESVESCNSAGLFSTGKKRRNFDPESCVGSKSVKTKIQESPGSSSFVKQDSSFMIWISNMMKGFLKSKEDEAPPLALTLGNYNHKHKNRDKNLSPCNRNQDQECKTMGFQSIFQSLYCPKTKAQETVAFNTNNQTKGSKQLELDNMICDSNATPIACCMATDTVYKRFIQSNDDLNESRTSNGVAPAALTKLLSTNTASSQEINRKNSAENKILCNLATDEEKDGTSSNSSLRKHKRNSAENIDAELTSEGKAANNSSYKSDPLTSWWITRFTPKTPGPLSNRDLCTRNTGEALYGSSDSMRLKAQWQNHPTSFHDHIVGAWEEEHSTEDPVYMQNCADSTEVSFGISKVNEHHDEKSICKLNSILPCSRYRHTEAIASVFARRLDALRHIMPSHATDDSANGSLTCFFCGVKGHHVRDCPEITDSELEDLLRNANSYNGAKELHCVCIRCFQSNHWAVACPNASSRTRHQAEYGEYSQLEAADAPTVCSGKLNEAFASGTMNLNMKLCEEDIASSSGKKMLRENQVTPLSNFVDSQISDLPKGIFYAVKRLRLSRTVILK
ncbi:unnamed protein product [Dovyalis caffra]|uniref:CCHC-type domain-containing protein n=1 Tax=Dovyalis caffra TaxID=77055 RepID=A0AAV1QZV4_9ROSI|nr:unnamed protein product [Dovyalis caffra]